MAKRPQLLKIAKDLHHATGNQPEQAKSIETKVTYYQRSILASALSVGACLAVACGSIAVLYYARQKEFRERYLNTFTSSQNVIRQYAGADLGGAEAAFISHDFRLAFERLVLAQQAALSRKQKAEEQAIRRQTEEKARQKLAEEAKRRRLEEDARQAGETAYVDLGGGLTVEMVWCPQGTFMCGSPSNEACRVSGEVAHRVTLTRGFWLGKCEVSQALWEAVMGTNPSRFKKAGKDAPVDSVSWVECQAFLDKLNSRLKLEKTLPDGRFRFPTEAEWEYACRAGTKTPFNRGTQMDSAFANFDGRLPYGGASEGSCRYTTVKTGSYAPNAWNLYDMHGNVWEWCADWQESYPSSSVTNPAGPALGTARVYRGGSWGNGAAYCRSAFRNWTAPVNRYDCIGLRLARDP